MYKTSRRELLRKGAILGMGIAGGSVLSTATAGPCSGGNYDSRWDDEYNFGHTILFMDEYYQGTMEILGCISGEIEHIGELSSRAVSVIKNGGTVWSSMNIGHMPSREQSENRRGNPRAMKEHNNTGTNKNNCDKQEHCQNLP